VYIITSCDFARALRLASRSDSVIQVVGDEVTLDSRVRELHR